MSIETDNNPLKRAFDRERSARKEAERIMEQKSLELFQANEKLQELNALLERKVEERTAEIIEREAQLSHILENHPVPMVLYRLQDAKIVAVNQTAVRNYGYSEDEFLQKCIQELHPKDQQRMVEEHLSRLREGSDIPKEWRHVRSNGDEFEVEVTATSMEYAGQNCRLILVKDVTEARMAENELRQAKELAENSVKLKEQFMANMSHEIRTPMNAIVGMGELLHESNLSDRQETYVKAIRSSSENLLNIINDILDFSKIESGQLHIEYLPVDVRSLCEKVVEMASVRANEKGIVLKLDAPVENRGYMVDPTRLNQVLMNLVSNAVKFTDTGSVVLSCNISKSNETTDSIRFLVKDTGIGIPPEKQAKVFESFIQAEESTARKYGGTGLGLPISKQLVELMGGSLELESEEGIGSEFSFDLELTRTKLETDPNLSQGLDVSLLVGKRILLVEDNRLNILMAQTILESVGCQVDVALNGIEAVVKAKQAAHDAILMDMRMPEMDGITATGIIRSQTDLENVPIIALTANAIKGDREKCIDAGMDEYVTKPFKRIELLGALLNQLTPGSSINVDQTTSSEKGAYDSLADISKLKANLGDDESFIKKMVGIFIESTPGQLQLIRDAAELNDSVKLQKVVHRLRPSISYLAKESLFIMASNLEHGEYPGDLVQTSEQFCSKMEQLIKDLERV